MAAAEQLVETARPRGLIGSELGRVDAALKVTGSIRYVRDLKLPRMLYAAVKRSPLAHARIVKIDSSLALREPAVRAFISGVDFPSEASGVDTPPLAVDKVLYANQAVAAVAAETEARAREAVELVAVQYEELPAIFTVDEAMSPRPRATISHAGETCESPNVGRHMRVRHGDTERALREADRIVEKVYTTGAESQLQLEPCTFLAEPDYDGGVTIWATSSGPHKTQLEVARYLGLSPHLVRVRVPFLGGWFGSKEESHMAAACALLAIRSRRPVKLSLTREEVMTALGVRHPSKIWVKDGVMKDGRILARKITAYYDGGAYGSLGNSILKNSVLGAVAVYGIPNVTIDSYRVYTNRVPGTPKPGTMGPQIFWAIESQMDEVASLLHIDPLDLRLRHVLKEGDENAIGEEMRSICYDVALREAARRIGWNRGGERKRDGPWRTGRGIAVAAKWASGGIGQATVKVRETGQVEVWVDIVENGQGIFTGITQIVADEFGIPPGDVILMPLVQGSRSESSGLADGASSSRQLVYLGNAVRLASEDAKRKLRERGATLLKVDPARAEVTGKRVVVKGESRSVSVSQLFSAVHIYGGTGAYVSEVELAGHGTYFKEVGKFDPASGHCVGPPISPYYVSVAQAVELRVNTETGRVKVDEVVAVMDVGRAVNPALVRSQIVNAVTMGLSAALGEELVFSEGRASNANPADYKILTAVDAPTIVPVILEVPYDEGPFGAKGAGNPSILPTAPAVRNAIHDATGAWVDALPMTPERVLDAIAGSPSAL